MLQRVLFSLPFFPSRLFPFPFLSKIKRVVYCYTSPHSDVTDHCLMLRGYYTVTDKPEIPQFGISLTHPELPSIRVKLETLKNFSDWVRVFDESLEENINHTPMMRSVSAEAPTSRRKRSIKLKATDRENNLINSRSTSHQPTVPSKI